MDEKLMKNIVCDLLDIYFKVDKEFDKLDKIIPNPWESDLWAGGDILEVVARIMELPVDMEHNWDWLEYVINSKDENNTSDKMYNGLLQYKKEFYEEFSSSDVDEDDVLYDFDDDDDFPFVTEDE